jgi:hypothetical protein
MTARRKKTRERIDQLLSTYIPDVFLDIGANLGIYSWHARSPTCL